jgi:sulfate adenylyltransferase
MIAPYGGRLVNLLVSDEALQERRAYASKLPSLQLSERSICDLELLAIGAFSPLDRFMNREDHQRVVHEMRLANGHLFPVPITLPVERGHIKLDQDVALRTSKNDLLAILTIEHIYECRRGLKPV